ncbi:MAG: alpha/beta fold hydrolase [Caldilineaceae bacterium]
MNLEVITCEPEGPPHATPILFVHGMWHAAWCWAENFLPFFAQNGYQASALSLRGHGKSEGRKRLRWNTLADYVADVADVAARFATPPILVGTSMGGMVVQKYLESHPTPAAVLLGSGPPGGVIPATLRTFRRQPLAFVKANLTLSMYPVVGTPQLAREALFSSAVPEKQTLEYYGRLQDESYRAYLDMLGLNLPRSRKIKTPMLVLGSAGDAIVSVGDVETTARAYGVKAEIFGGMGHDTMLEPRWREVAERMLAWFQEQGL